MCLRNRAEHGSYFYSDVNVIIRVCLYDLLLSAESDRHILVEIALTWSDAQAYCRSTYTDLSSIHSEQDNQQVGSLLWSGTGGMWVGWIGLHRKGWVWSDRSSAPYRQWANQDFDGTRACATMTSSSDWSRSDCSNRNFFLCYTGQSASTVL